MRLSVAFLSALAAVGSVPTALARMQFLSPPAFTGFVEPSRHPVRVIGTPLELEWTRAAEGKKISVMLYQLDATRAATFNGRFQGSDSDSGEFILHDEVDVTSSTWFVGTDKDLSISPMFAIAVWQDGKQVTDSATNIFNITYAATETTSSAVSSTSSTATSMSSTATSTTTSISSSSESPSVTPGDGGAGLGTGSDSPAIDQSATAATTGLSTGAAVGVGIGAAFAGMLLLGLAWYLWRCCWVKKRQDMAGGEAALVAPEYYQAPSDKFYYTGPPVEAPLEPFRRHELS